MAKTASQIVDRALSLIDEVPTSFTTAATTETSIREQALSILPEVCRDLVKELPWELKRYLSEEAVIFRIPLTDGSLQNNYIKQKVTILLPLDYWELVDVYLPVWSKIVTKYIFIDSPEYAKQNNPFTRAGKQNPVLAISKHSDNSRILELFSINDNDSISGLKVRYIKFSNVPDDSGKTWPDELFDEITKALAIELNIIKSRIDEAVIRGEEVTNSIEQHQ